MEAIPRILPRPGEPAPAEDAGGLLADADWPVFGWQDDIRPALAAAIGAGRPVALATLYKVEGSAPRGPGAQMLFDGCRATGYFSGDCIEGDVAAHAAAVLADGKPRRLHYGQGSPWIDIRLRCGGALHILVERIAADSTAAAALLEAMRARRSCTWRTDGIVQTLGDEAGPPVTFREAPFAMERGFHPPRRLVVSGGDPGALALARLATEAGFQTVLVRPGGPERTPPFPVWEYCREHPAKVLERLGTDRWTAYVGATHEDHHDLGGCLHALRHGAGYVAMIGARSRVPERVEALARAGATREELDRLHFSPGIVGLGKAPWEVATGIVADVMRALNPVGVRV